VFDSACTLRTRNQRCPRRRTRLPISSAELPSSARLARPFDDALAIGVGLEAPDCPEAGLRAAAPCVVSGAPGCERQSSRSAPCRSCAGSRPPARHRAAARLASGETSARCSPSAGLCSLRAHPRTSARAFATSALEMLRAELRLKRHRPRLTAEPHGVHAAPAITVYSEYTRGAFSTLCR
jgi:hypothetical protein